MGYPGGKAQAGVYQTIINQIPPHDVYIEPFLGAGAVMRYKRPARVSIGVDCDGSVLARWSGSEVPSLRLLHADALAFLGSYQWRGSEFVYCDPPYLFAARRSQRQLYLAEFGEAGQHRELLSLLRTIPAAVAISGYWSQLYGEELAGWRSITFPAMTRGGVVAEEWVWMNYPAPVQLHDYSYLGADFRERERIKRKASRWRSRLAAMPALERAALLSAVDEFRSSLAGCGEVDEPRDGLAGGGGGLDREPAIVGSGGAADLGCRLAGGGEGDVTHVENGGDAGARCQR